MKKLLLSVLYVYFSLGFTYGYSFPQITFAEKATNPILYSAKEYGAVGDGETKDTIAIQKAIDAAADAGGGTVFFPPGKYLSGTLFLKNNITLYLENGAVLLGSVDADDFPLTIPAFRSYTDKYVRQSLIFGEHLRDVAIVGKGTIDGQGAAFRWKEYLNRPYNIRLISCSNVLIEGIRLRNSPMWMQHYLDCDHVTIRGIRVENHVTYNNDGIDIDCCRNVVISDCVIDSDDDALCLKSTADRPTENVTITNCILSSHCNALKMGTESNGGFRNISISNCSIQSSYKTESIYGVGRGLAGIALEIVDGGEMDRIAISNIAMRGVKTPIFLRLGNRARPFKEDMPKPKMGAMRNIHISNVVATDVDKIGCSITGLPDHPIENVTLNNIRITFDGGGTNEEAYAIVPEKPDSYPESTMFGVLPAYGFYCRHGKGLRFNQIDLDWKENDLRPALICEDVADVEVQGWKSRCLADGFPMIVFNSVRDALIRGSRTASDAAVFLRIVGTCEKISVIGNDLRGSSAAFEYGEGVDKTELFHTANRMK
ncbi:MAG: glycoside hydrolase family 28 protein [Candidatus Omnitrophota bacterium]|jgi:hypothetical protein|nr:MAG: glycoside hydrolase family 28 protein [Candidatus Omnitrophota bacterium]